MKSIIYFAFGLSFIIIIIKVLFKNPVTIKVYPTLSNYKDIIYVDESGKLYKYDLIIMQK